MDQPPETLTIPTSWLRFTRNLNVDWARLLAILRPRPKPDGPQTAPQEPLQTALDKETANRLVDRWIVRARPDQLPPDDADDPWRTWLILGGRGAGKTRAGAEWLSAGAEKGRRLALVGPSLHDVREVMIEGPSGLKAVAAPGDQPRYEVSRRRLIWPHGGVAYAHSAEDPESLRGPEFDGAWCDEFCVWPRAEETLALLRMGVRRGSDPRLVVTTTPKPALALRRLMAEPGVVTHRLPTLGNAENLPPVFLEHLMTLYGETRLAAQELEGLVVDDGEGALWRAADLLRCRGARPPALDRIVVAVDPPVSQGGDACGVIVAGRAGRRAFVLADRTVKGLSPLGWARQAAEAVAEFGATSVVAEVNQGGDMVRSTLVAAECRVPIRMVRARVGKRARAEPVAALYDQGRVVHCDSFPELEEEMMGLGTGDLSHSPDRADALVWALTDLLLGDAESAPRVRRV
jgi:phage terminase large subunit-like protein